MKDIKWELIIQGRVLMADDINANSALWNPYYHRQQNATVLEGLIEQYRLLINNEPGRLTRPTIRDVSVIDLDLSTTELGP